MPDGGPWQLNEEEIEWMNAPMGPITTAARLGAIYDDALVAMRAVALSHGYALATHGSQMRDLDVIAVPWEEWASPAALLADGLRAAVGGTFSVGTQSGEVMTVFPHGRMAWAIHLRVPARLRDELASSKLHLHPYVDLSVMPRVEEAGSA